MAPRYPSYHRLIARMSKGTHAYPRAPGFKKVTAKCWKQGRGFGSDSTVATVTLDGKGNGSFVFPANDYPHGPIMLRISGALGSLKDNCYLQLYNKGGVSWNEGIPGSPSGGEGHEARLRRRLQRAAVHFEYRCEGHLL